MTDPPTDLLAGLDHLQLEVPAGHEASARAFYGGVLRLPELRRPAGIAHIPGLWFALPDGRQLHTGVVDEFAPRTFGHPCLRTSDLDKLMAQLERCGVAYAVDTLLPDVRRVFFNDPFGNRLEVVEGQHLSALAES